MRYRVCGAHSVLGHRPGEEFEAVMGQDLEDFYVLAGHLERVASQADEPEPDDTHERGK